MKLVDFLYWTCAGLSIYDFYKYMSTNDWVWLLGLIATGLAAFSLLKHTAYYRWLEKYEKANLD